MARQPRPHAPVHSRSDERLRGMGSAVMERWSVSDAAGCGGAEAAGRTNPRLSAGVSARRVAELAGRCWACSISRRGPWARSGLIQWGPSRCVTIPSPTYQQLWPGVLFPTTPGVTKQGQCSSPVALLSAVALSSVLAGCSDSGATGYSCTTEMNAAGAKSSGCESFVYTPTGNVV